MKKLLILITFFALNSPLFAKEGEIGFGIDAGYGFVDIGAEETGQTIANISGSTVLASYDRGAIVGRIYFDYGVSDEILFEAGYFQSGDIEAKYTLSGASATESYSVNGFDIAAVYTPDNSGYFFKGGFHSSEISGNASITISGTTYAAKATASGGGFLIGGGFDYGDSSRVGYTYYANIGGDKEADVGLFYYGWRF
jgi:hypothetical protein